jgi:DNA-binding CsgD family transcriptional regulator
VPGLAAEALALARSVGDKQEIALALGMQALIVGLAGGSAAMRPYIEEALPLARAAGFSLGLLLAQVAYLMFRLFESAPDETRRLAEEAVAAAEAHADRHNRLFAKGFAGIEALVHGRLADAARILESVVAEGRATIDTNYLQSLVSLGWVAVYRGDFEGARRHLAEALAEAPKRGSDSVSIRSIAPIARWVDSLIELALGNPASASQSLAVVVDVARSAMISHFASLPLVFLAQAQLGQGELDESAAFLDEAGALARAGGLTWVLGRIARVRAEVMIRKGDVQEAETLAHEALGLGREAGDQLGVVDALELLARLAAEQESHREAARLWAAAESLRAQLGYARFPAEQPGYEAALAQAREGVGPNAFRSAWDEGARLSADEAIAYAARGRGERKRPTTGWASLTPSELEVVRLVGEHLSNPEIAARLFVSRATVKTHLVHIFAKLGIESRSELAAQAISRRQTSAS